MELTAKLKDLFQEFRVIVVTQFDDSHYLEHAYRAGAAARATRARGRNMNAWRSDSARKGFVAALLALAVLPFAGCEDRVQQARVALEKVTIASPPYLGLAPVYIAHAKGFFSEEGLDVTLLKMPSGKAGLEAVMAGTADFVPVSEIPLALAIMRGESVAIVATFFAGERDHGLIVRKTRAIRTPAEMRGMTIAYTAGTTSQFLLDLLLSDAGLSKEDVHAVNLDPQEMAAAMARGEVDAASTWHPALGEIQGQLGDKGVTLDGKGVFSLSMNLAGRQDFVKAHPAAVQQTLTAIARAVRYIHANEAESIRITAAYGGMDEALLRQLWKDYRFDLKLDQSLVIALEDTSRWAIRNRLTAGADVPNYVDFIFAGAMTSFNPAAVRLIR